MVPGADADRGGGILYTVYEHLGHDFRHYSDASRNRRLVGFVRRHSLGTISEAQGRVLRDPELQSAFLSK